MQKLPPHIWVEQQQIWEQCLNELEKVNQIAIDLESNGLFAYRESICLIQISTRDKDYIIDPFAELEWERFGRIIENPDIEKVLHACEYDLILMSRQHGWQMQNLFDTMWAARILGHEKIGLASMLNSLYSIEIDKKYQRANWGARPLKPDQLNYAQTDTHFLLGMRDDLAQQLKEKGNWEEAQEIFAEQCEVRVPNLDFDTESFWSINGVMDLNHRGRAILRELNIFRDKESYKRNRPPFKVFSNKTLVQIAGESPKNLSELGRINGMSHKQVQRYGHQLLRVAAAGSKASVPKQIRRPRTPDDIMNRYDKLRQWRKEHGLERKVPSDVVLYRETMWELAQQNPQSLADLDNIESLGPWRKATYGPKIIELLAGT